MTCDQASISLYERRRWHNRYRIKQLQQCSVELSELFVRAYPLKICVLPHFATQNIPILRKALAASQQKDV
jgi:hypothetical protein